MAPQACPFREDCRVADIDAYLDTTVVVWSDGQGICWGDASGGGCPYDRSFFEWPTAIPALRELTSATLAGDTHGARTTAGEAMIWGYAPRGERGEGIPFLPVYETSIAPNVPAARKVATGSGVTAILDYTGRVAWWGTVDITLKEYVRQDAPAWPDLPPIHDIAASGTICAVAEDGRVFCWGSNTFGGIGDGTRNGRLVPYEVPGIHDADEVVMGTGSTCVHRTSGAVTCWGLNRYGQIGRGDDVDPKAIQPSLHLTPGDVLLPEPVEHVFAREETACATRADRRLYCWGANTDAQFVPSPAFTSAPILSPDLTDVVDVALGLVHLCILKSDGTVWCRGYGLNLGRGFTTDGALGKVDFTQTKIL